MKRKSVNEVNLRKGTESFLNDFQTTFKVMFHLKVHGEINWLLEKKCWDLVKSLKPMNSFRTCYAYNMEPELSSNKHIPDSSEEIAWKYMQFTTTFRCVKVEVSVKLYRESFYADAVNSKLTIYTRFGRMLVSMGWKTPRSWKWHQWSWGRNAFWGRQEVISWRVSLYWRESKSSSGHLGQWEST